MSKVFENNIIVQRRLAFLPKEGAAVAKKFLDGKMTIEDIVEKYDISTTHAIFGVRQHAVEAGLVKTLSLDPNDTEQVRKAHGGEHADWAWLSCRLGVTAQRLQAAAKGEQNQPKPTTTTASSRGKQGKTGKTGTRARRGGKQS